MSLVGRVAVVTGASRGLGQEIALGLAREGAALVLVARSPKDLQAVCKRVRRLGVRALAVSADVSRDPQVARVTKRALQAFGRVDVLVNNAAVQGPTRPIGEISVVDWDATLAADLTAPFLCVRSFADALAANGRGSVINISSLAALKGVALRSPYCAAKMGLIGLTRSLALELGPRGVRVNAVCPGPFPSPTVEAVVIEKSRTTGEPCEKLLEQTLRSSALKRPVTIAEVVATVLFLASDGSSGMTGQTLTVAGG